MPNPLAPGAQLGAYRLLAQLGAGGMGEVWLAEHTMLGRRAAIKVLHESFSRRPEIIARFFNEARAATAISDPGIVQIFDFGHREDGVAFIVMEMLEGESLEQRLQRRGTLPVSDTLRLMRQIAASLGAAHARGIVHRDLKPDNVFIVGDPEVAGGERTKLLDFGIAKLSGDVAGVKTKTSAVMGTPTYMSPEQCRGAGEVDQRSDVYSLGCMIFRCIAGRPPFDADGPGDVIAMHLREPVPSLSVLVREPLGELETIVMRCLDKNAARRFASGTAVAAALAAVSATTGDHARPVVIGASPGSWPPSVPTTLSAASSEIIGGRVRSRRVVVAVSAFTTLCVLAAITARAVQQGPAIAEQIDAHTRVVAVADAGPPDVAEIDPPQLELDAAPPDAAPPDAMPPDTKPSHAPRPSRPGRDPDPKRPPAPARPRPPEPCNRAAFTAVIDNPAATNDALQSALAQLRACKSTLPDAIYLDLQRKLVKKL